MPNLSMNRLPHSCVQIVLKSRVILYEHLEYVAVT